MTHSHHVKLNFCLLCDEVRREDNGQMLVVGLYTGGPILHELPAVFEASILCSFDMRGIEKENLDFSLEGHGFSGKGTVPWEENAQATTADLLLPIQCLVEQAGPITFRWASSQSGEGFFTWNIYVSDRAKHLTEEAAEKRRAGFKMLYPSGELHAVAREQ